MTSTRSRGFTLLELVLAMTALAMLTAICYAAFHLAIRAIERGEVAVVTTQRLRVASDVLIRQIKSTVPYPARNKDLDVYPYFIGNGTSMAFVTAGGLQGGGSLVRVVYQVVDNPTRLVMTETTFFSPDTLGRDTLDTSHEHQTVLLDNFKTLHFQYYRNDGTADLDGATAWVEAWDGHEEESMPSAVWISVEGAPGLEIGQWNQQIPIMATNYGDNTGEVDDESLAESPDEDTDTEGGGD
jgi:prepilin-type N-terminal cleavage/methylation domain-containing protein